MESESNKDNITDLKQDAADAEDTALLDFHIGKAYASLYEAGKELRNGFLSTLLFLGVTAMLIYGDSDAKATVPLFGVQLTKLYAAEVTSMLTCAAFYYTLASKCTERLLYFKIKELIARRFKQERFHWHLYYPSIFTSAELFGYLSHVGKVVWVVPFSLLAILIPIIALAYTIGKSLGWPMHAILSCGVSLILILLGIATALATPSASDDMKDVIRRIEE